MITQVAIFSETNTRNETPLEQEVNEFLEKINSSQIISIKHRTTTNKWQEHTVTVLITYNKNK